MKSVAIWYDKSDPENKPDLDIHLNFWKLPEKLDFKHKICRLFKNNSSGAFEKFLDIGLHIKDTSQVNKIHIYFPFLLKKDNISDLGRIICKSPSGSSLLSAIFNERYSVKDKEGSLYNKVEDDDNKEIFNIYELDISSDDIEVKEDYSGTVVTINLPEKSEKNSYFRLRFKTDNLIDFSSIEENQASILDSAFTKIEIFDFRINSLRHLPNKLNEKVPLLNSFAIKKIHFFYICSYRENYLLSHTPFFGARKLEEGVWDDYISNGNSSSSKSNETVVAYHWSKVCKKDEAGIKHFNVLMKTDFKHKNWGTILKYLVYTAIFAIIIGLITSLTYDVMKTEWLDYKKVISDTNEGGTE